MVRYTVLRQLLNQALGQNVSGIHIHYKAYGHSWDEPSLQVRYWFSCWIWLWSKLSLACPLMIQLRATAEMSPAFRWGIESVAESGCGANCLLHAHSWYSLGPQLRWAKPSGEVLRSGANPYNPRTKGCSTQLSLRILLKHSVAIGSPFKVCK